MGMGDIRRRRLPENKAEEQPRGQGRVARQNASFCVGRPSSRQGILDRIRELEHPMLAPHRRRSAATCTALAAAWILLSAAACVAPRALAVPAPRPDSVASAPSAGPREQDPSATTPAPDPGFSFAVEPYLWAAGITGDVRVGGGRTASVSAEFEDLLENLEGGIMLAGEAWFSPEWGMLGDVTWMDLAGEASGPVGAASLRGTNELWHAQVSAAWRPPGQDSVVFDLLGGVRLIDVEAGLQTNLFSSSVGETLFDPVVGVRATIPIGAKFQVVTLADVGGFGVGTDLSYQLLATFGWKLSHTVGIGLGWRQLGMDFDEDDLAMDVAFSGPLLGMRIAF